MNGNQAGSRGLHEEPISLRHLPSGDDLALTYRPSSPKEDLGTSLLSPY